MTGRPDADRTPRVLVVDGEVETRGQALALLQGEGVSGVVAPDGRAAWLQFKAAQPDLVLSRLVGRNLDGLGLLRQIRRRANTPFVAQAAPFEFGHAIQAVKEGAIDALRIPYCREEFRERILPLLSQRRLEAALHETIVGSSREISILREKVVALCKVRVPVLIHGEPGSGRGLVARSLTALDGDREMISVRPGDSIAPMQRLSGANVYLESVEKHSESAQNFWHRVLTEDEAGAPDRPHRLIASTALDLGPLSERGLFDDGLADRLGRFPLHLPPLRDRLTDLRELVAALAVQASRRVGIEPRPVFTSGAIASLERFPWRGNVEQLARVVEKLTVFAGGGSVTKRSVDAVLAEGRSVRTSRELLASEQRDALVREIRAAGGNLAEVGRRIGMSRGAVIYRAQKYGLMPQRSKRRRGAREP